MTMLNRTTLLVLLTLTVGCYASYSRQKLVSQLPRGDGSMLQVECVSYVKHTISSVSPTLQPQPQVTIIMDERTFVIRADEILLNDQPYATLADDVKKVRIEITQEGFEVTVDGKPVVKLAESL
jgi:hypothetical protein